MQSWWFNPLSSRYSSTKRPLMTDILTTLAYNAILVRRNLAISSISGQVPKDTLRALRNSPVLGNLMFYISPENLENLKKTRNECYMFQVLKQAAQFKHSQPPEFKIPKFKISGSFRGSASTSQAKTKPRAYQPKRK